MRAKAVSRRLLGLWPGLGGWVLIEAVFPHARRSERSADFSNTKCVFDSYGKNGEVFIRFELGANKTLQFAIRDGQTSGKYYLKANWQTGKGGEINYGNETYFATPESGSAYLMVVLKKLNKTKRKDRVVKGMKV